MADIKIESNIDEVMDELTQQAQAAQKQLGFHMFRALTLVEAQILQNLRVNSGLHVRSGALLNSIGGTKKVTETLTGVEGEIGTEGVPYAAIHEFGGVTKAHDIYPRVGSALKFKIGSKEIFARVVHHPGSRIPARPYLRPALAAKQEEIMKEFGLFLQLAFKTKG